MEKLIRMNDTLKLTREQGFPEELVLETHLGNPYHIEDFKDKVFTFTKPLPRIYPLPPTRSFLVEERDGKWIKWGHALVLEQTIHEGETTSGKFKIIKLHDPEYMKATTREETPEGKSFF